MTTIRIVLRTVAAENLYLEQLNVKTMVQEEFGVQIEKELIWPKISSKTMVQEV